MMSNRERRHIDRRVEQQLQAARDRGVPEELVEDSRGWCYLFELEWAKLREHMAEQCETGPIQILGIPVTVCPCLPPGVIALVHNGQMVVTVLTNSDTNG